MSQKVNRTEFLQVLSLVEPGLATRNFIEQSSCYVFADGWCCTFNDEISVRARTGLPEEFRGAVRAKELKASLESITDDEVELQLTDRELRVSARRKKVDICREAEILLPVENVTVPEQWFPLPDDFRQAVETVIPSAGTNKEEFIACCLHITADYVEACDRVQAARYDVRLGCERDFLVRAASIGPAVKMGLVKWGETDEWFHLRNKAVAYSCRRHMMAYPDEQLGACFAATGEPCKLPQGGVEAAKLGGVFTTDKVRVRLTPGHMEVTSVGEFGKSRVDLECGYAGGELTFRIKPALLSQIISSHNECEIGKGKLRVNGDRWKYFCLLSRDEEVAAGKETPEPVAAGA